MRCLLPLPRDRGLPHWPSHDVISSALPFPYKMDRSLSNPPHRISRPATLPLLASSFHSVPHPPRAAASATASVEVAACTASEKARRKVTTRAKMAHDAAPCPRAVLGDGHNRGAHRGARTRTCLLVHLVSAVRLLPPHTGRRAQPSCRLSLTPSSPYPCAASPCSLLSLMLCL